MNEPPRLYKTGRFDRSFSRLPSLLQSRVRETLRKLRDKPELPGLNVEPVSGANRDLHSCRVNGRVRIIFRWRNGDIVLEFVGEHDRAYRPASWSALVTLWGEDSLTHSTGEQPSMLDPYQTLLPDEGLGLEEALEGLDLKHVPDTVGTLHSLIEDLLSEGTDGRATTATRRAGSGHGLVNVIPGEDAPCHNILLAVCFDADSFDNRLHEAMKHAEYECPETQAVIFATSKWEPKTWKDKWQVVFEGLSARVVILFAGPGGIRRIA